MRSNTIIAAALASAPLAHAIGSAIVVNQCKYQVKLSNVPSAYGGFNEIDMFLQPGDTYSQKYTQLTNGNGWSIKLSPDATLNNILQYEYTFHNDGTIWYDLSDVNGNPWDKNWEITAQGAGCSPKQQAYRYSTDDAYGMQSCGDAATITVTLCSGEEGSAAPSSSVAAAPTSTSTYVAPAPTTTLVAPAPTTPATTATSTQSHVFWTGAIRVANPTPEASTATSTTASRTFWTGPVPVANPTTLATLVSPTPTDDIVVVTEIATAYVTATAYAKRDVRPVHRHAHPHFRPQN